MSGGRIIVAAPRPIDTPGNSGSVVRIRTMVSAFEALGYEVETVAGRVQQRAEAIRQIVHRLDQGFRYDFMYVENHTIPWHLTEPKLGLLRRHPLTDLHLFAACRRHGVPIGVFYRDAWWRFPESRAAQPVYRWATRRPFYWLELLLYARFADVLYLPHLAMADVLPLSFRRIRALPPGTAIPPTRPPHPGAGPLQLFYVGGLGSFYRQHSLLEAVQGVDGVRLTICCRPEDWQRARASYHGLLSERIEVVHAHGPDLLPHFLAADVLSCFLSPHPYWRVTVPLKLFEYLGYAKPILAAHATNAGTFVAEHDVGWAIEDDPAALAALLARLRSRPAELVQKSANASRLAEQHTWKMRALQVADDLLALDDARLRPYPGRRMSSRSRSENVPPAERKPNLFIVGAMKCGTSSLHTYLGSHPEIFMSTPKEPSHFVDRDTLWRLWPEMARHGYWRRERYLDLFGSAGEAVILGESSTNYTKLPDVQGVPQRIRAFNPAARFIYLMRDPLQRTLSHYWHLVRMRRERRDMITALLADPQYLAVSHYALQLRPYFELFGPERVRTVVTEDLLSDPLKVVQDLFRWLGVDPTVVPPEIDRRVGATPTVFEERRAVLPAVDRLHRSRLWGAVASAVPLSLKSAARRGLYHRRVVTIPPTPPAGATAYLRPLLIAGTEDLSRLLGRDFPMWTTLYGRVEADETTEGRVPDGALNGTQRRSA